MAGSFNRITIVGNLGRDPETRDLPSGDTLVEISVATTERRRGADGQTSELTTWFRVSLFGKLGETAMQYLRKGSYVYVDGSLTTRDYTDRDGQPRHVLEVRAREMRMLDRREDAQAVAPAESPRALVAAGSPDLPF